MTVLGAGVFANIVFALIFYGLYVAFFFSSFAASGYIYNSYTMGIIPAGNITGFSNMTNGVIKVTTSNGNYYLSGKLVSQINKSDMKYLLAYTDAPAVIAQMKGAIVQADNVKITGADKLREFLNSKEPGESVKFITETGNSVNEYNITLGHRPDNLSRAYLGVVSGVPQRHGFIQNILGEFMSFKNNSTLYKPTWGDGVVTFIYNFYGG